MPVVPTIETMSATTALAVSIPPAPGPSSVISRIASPWSMTALKAPSTVASGWCASTKAGPTRTSTRPSSSVARASSLTRMSSASRGADVILRDGLDALDGDPVERHPRPEGDRREDRDLRRRVQAADVVRRVRLGVAEPLRLGERLVVRAAGVHRGEDEVGRPVDDPDDPVDVRHDERLAEHLDHRDRGADRRLEAELGTRRGRRCEELRAAARDELLVRRDDRAARPEEREHVCARRVDSAHHLGDDPDRGIVDHLARRRS